LASGLGIALKAIAPHVTIIGVETKASTAFAVSLARGVITAIKPLPSLADGLTGNLEPGSMTFELVRRHVDRVVSVSETDLERAIRELATEEHLIAEGAGAAATAAVLTRLAVDAGQRSAVMLTGGNIDQSRFISVAATAESPPGSGGSVRDARAGRE
jgi:threonine dehydratase